MAEPRDMAESCEQGGNFDIIDKGSGNTEIEGLIRFAEFF
jgi:hypothetical protein